MSEEGILAKPGRDNVRHRSLSTTKNRDSSGNFLSLPQEIVSVTERKKQQEKQIQEVKPSSRGRM